MENTEKLKLSPEASKHFVEGLQENSEPNDTLKQAAENYKNSLALGVEIENDDIELTLEAERDFGDKVGTLSVTLDDNKTVSAKIKLEF